MKELPSTWTHEWKDVLEIRSRTGGTAQRRRVEDAPPRGEENEGSEPATDLDGSGMDVLVRHAIAREVQQRPDEERRSARPAGRAGGGSRRNMERDDHGPWCVRVRDAICRMSRRSAASSAFSVLRRVLRPNTPLTIHLRASWASGRPTSVTSGVRRGLR